MIISVTMDLALDQSITYSGGLGILEGDKFYAMGDAGVEYLVFTLFYRHGYVKQKIHGDSIILEGEEQNPGFLRSITPEPDMKVRIRGEEIVVRPFLYEYKTARAILFEAVCPRWARDLTDRIYIEKNEHERFLKHVLLAKAAYQYAHERIGWEKIDVFDFQETSGVLSIYSIPEGKARFVTHTPGPWGHPSFPKEMIEQEFQEWKMTGSFPDLNDWPDMVNLTEFAMTRAHRVFTVSKKHWTITRKLFSRFEKKIDVARNGVSRRRWQAPPIFEAMKTNSKEAFRMARKTVSDELRKTLGIPLDGNPLILWARRMTRYKRPYLVQRFIEEHVDFPGWFILGGRPHPDDHEGIRAMKEFYELSQRYEHVFFIENYTVGWARKLLAGVDIHLFTPFPGWEACGTSFMKAGMNGVITIASRDGGALECIEHGRTGFFFGHETEELRNIFEGSDELREIENQDYNEFKSALLEACEMYMDAYEDFEEMQWNTARHFTSIADIRYTLLTLYPWVAQNFFQE